VLAAVLAVAACGLAARKRLPQLSWSLAFYAATLAPASLISAVLWPGFGRFLYLPCAGLALGLGQALAAIERAWVVRWNGAGAPVVQTEQALTAIRSSADRGGDLPARPFERAGPVRWSPDTPVVQRARGALAALALAYLAFLGVRQAAYTRDYQSEYALYAAALREAPDSANAHARMATYQAVHGKFDEALAGYRRAIELDGGEPSYALQAVYFSMQARRFDEAQEIAIHALVTLPERYSAGFQQLLARVRSAAPPAGAR
jgi:tetratricopeptide (TPR) repeat protein